MIDQLGRGNASISSLQIDRHEEARPSSRADGLVVTQKLGRVRTCRHGKRGLKTGRIEAHRKFFEARFEVMDESISEMNEEGRNESAS